MNSVGEFWHSAEEFWDSIIDCVEEHRPGSRIAFNVAIETPALVSGLMSLPLWRDPAAVRLMWVNVTMRYCHRVLPAVLASEYNGAIDCLCEASGIK